MVFPSKRSPRLRNAAIAQDPFGYNCFIINLAMIYAWTGEKDSASSNCASTKGKTLGAPPKVPLAIAPRDQEPWATVERSCRDLLGMQCLPASRRRSSAGRAAVS